MAQAQDEKGLTTENKEALTLDEALKVACKAIKEGAECATILDPIVAQFGVEALQKYRFQAGKHQNSLIHSLVTQKLGPAVEYFVKIHKFDINVPRPSDSCTPLHLSIWTKQPELSALLLDLGADPSLTNSYGESCAQLKETVDVWRSKCMNLVWLDFELDSLPLDALAAGKKPKVLECCVIITNNDLEPLEEKSWVIHLDEDAIKELSPWHQQNFGLGQDGGNGLFQDCLASTTPAEQFEQELFDMLQRHCVEKNNMLAGNSVHVDQQVLAISLPRIARFLNHRVLDVSVLNSIALRWYPESLEGLDECYKTYQHRARGDVLSSIAQLKFYKSGLLKQQQAAKKEEEEKKQQPAAAKDEEEVAQMQVTSPKAEDASPPAATAATASAEPTEEKADLSAAKEEEELPAAQMHVNSAEHQEVAVATFEGSDQPPSKIQKLINDYL